MVDEGPLLTYLPYLNLGLGMVLGVLGRLVKVKGGNGVMWWGFEWLPMGIYGLIMLAKFVMGGVDPERELKELRYGFKGA